MQQVKELERLSRLTRIAGTCASLTAFEEALREELPKPPTSTRGKRRPKKSAE